MPNLINKIEGLVFNYSIGNITYIKNITSEIQQEDYINLNGYNSFLQNLSSVNDTFLLTKPMNFGIKNSLNLQTKIIHINY